MLVQPPKKNATLALTEPEITGRTHPVLPTGEWGINLAAAQLVYPDHGLQVLINQWLTMGKGDTVILLLNGNEVDRRTIVDDTEIDKRTTLFVAPRHLQTGSHTLSYSVKRLNQETEIYTPGVKIYVKVELPGGQDTEEGPGHSNLNMFIPPEIVEDFVDNDIAEEGVPIVIRALSGIGKPYPEIAVGDRLQFSWGGVLFWSEPVTAEQINDPFDNPITITVTKNIIEEAGDTDDFGLAVTFRSRDIVHNYSEDWCKETRIRVSLGTALLDAPIVNAAVNNVLDLDDVDDEFVTVMVWATRGNFQLDDTIELKARGTNSDGETVEFIAPRQQIKNLPHVYEMQLQSADLRTLVNSQVIFSYRLIRAGSTEPLRSQGQFVQVNGQATRLAAPIAVDADQGSLDPDLISTRVLIPFDPLILFEMAIALVWFGIRPDGSIYYPSFEWYFPDKAETEDPDGFFITVEGSHLKTLEGGTLVLSYVLLSDNNGEIVRRESRKATTLNVGEPQFELIKPIVLGENDGALEPSDLPNGSSRLTAPRPVATATKQGDILTYTWNGEKTGIEEDARNITALNENMDIHFPLNPAFVATHLEPNRGHGVSVTYKLWRKASGTFSYSNPLKFVVGKAQQPILDPGNVLEVVDGVLDPANALNGAHVEIPPNSPDNAGDHFFMKWASEDGVIEKELDKAISGNNKGKPVEFLIDHSVVQASVDKKVTLSYRVELFNGDKANGKDYEFSVEAQAFKLPVATLKEATGPQQDQLNPDDVYPNGATVVIPANAQLKTDDEITVTIVGKTTTPLWHKVLAAQEDKELALIKVPHALISANIDLSISMSYVIKRKAGGQDGPSNPTVYDIRQVIGVGTLKIMGARYNRSTYRASSATRLLSAFNATTGQPLQAQWKYASDNEWKTAATWRDSSPQESLQVRTAEDQVTLNSANIIGNGIDTTVTGLAAFVAHRDVGDVVGWGNAAYGANIPSTIITMDDIVEVSCTRSAFAARRVNGAVVAWGTVEEGANMAGVDPLNFVSVIGNGTAFAGLKNTGRVVAWGKATDGAEVPAPISDLDDIVQIIAAGQAFAALRASGHVVAWGLAANGGVVPSDIAGFDDIQTMIGSFGAFAAHRGNGRIVAWGHATYAGAVPADIAAMTDIIELSCANAQAFTARRATGQVVAWGTAEYGGTIDQLIGGLTDIVEVSSTWRAFAARRGNGHVVAWGRPLEGGEVPPEIAGLNDIVQVCGSSMAFAALRKNGTVVAWGDATVGGDTSAVVDQLTQVQALYDNTHGFTALTADGRVVTWGHAGGGGDSSAVQDRLLGKVSYEASPVTRGLALMASRWVELNSVR